jgi:hypothetical protein
VKNVLVAILAGVASTTIAGENHFSIGGNVLTKYVCSGTVIHDEPLGHGNFTFNRSGTSLTLDLYSGFDQEWNGADELDYEHLNRSDSMDTESRSERHTGSVTGHGVLGTTISLRLARSGNLRTRPSQLKEVLPA